MGFWGFGGFGVLGFRVLGFRVLGFRVLGCWGLGLEGFGVLGFRFRVWGLGLGLKVQDLHLEAYRVEKGHHDIHTLYSLRAHTTLRARGSNLTI